MSARPVLRVLTGATASGKTARALDWAEWHGAEIVSCDSLLFYRGMDIGTAKPTRAELARVPHHLVDIVEPCERYDVQRYVAEARAAVDEIAARGRPVLVVGGSGFYLRSFFAPMSDGIEVDPTLRAQLEARLKDDGIESLVAELHALNPAGLGALDLQNPRRVVRALERCRASGRALAELAAEFAAKPSAFTDFDVRLARLECEPAELERRIAARVQAMLAAGLVDEVRRLDAAGLRENPSAARAIGYREVLDVLDGKLRADELEAAIVRNTRALVKKQRTWFRSQLPPHRVLAASDTAAELFGE
ncbi:MAG TPA: tRNA (adenosine(37)-N6)-dimethylallyltransferase MiaA [Opitutaceae bacterium]|nr:tRNA (adenosine(37)-N6)-dimethylallyltransferase MiaA [Opitutaceae bacterium]